VQFIDEATIEVVAGQGGDGIIAWRREKYVPRGGPAGGDGGRGASVYVEATSELSTLVEFRFKRLFAATSGKGGDISRRSGLSADDIIVPVPIGTLVYRAFEGQTEAFLADLSENGQRVLVAKGGRGGRGNQHFANAVRQAPHYAEKGEPGEKCALRFELRLLADCGVIGVPNAGKSTLLSVVSAARPKIADYPFTTIEPQLGVVRVSEEASFVMVDVPGLIEGAHEGAGLGDQFLRHIERTRVLIHMLDGAKSLEEMLADKTIIEAELSQWNASLVHKPTLLVVSKQDLPDAQERLTELRAQFPEAIGISAATMAGIKELTFAAWETIQRAPLPELALPAPALISLKTQDAFHITREPDGTFVVGGERVERLAQMTDFESDEALARFERVLAKMGVEKKLLEMGIVEGDSVRVVTYEFTYS
jgi:GTP-binding protein